MAHVPSLRIPLAASFVGLAIFGLSPAAGASLGGPCLVPLAPNADKAAAWLEDCVAQVNAGGVLAPTEIIFEAPQTYALTSPIDLRRDVVIHGEGQVLTAGPTFSGDSLMEVGVTCPVGGCTGPIEVTIEDMEFTSPKPTF